MAYDDHFDLRDRRHDFDDMLDAGDLPYRPRVAPGKVTLTSSLPPVAGASAGPVQRAGAGGGAAAIQFATGGGAAIQFATGATARDPEQVRQLASAGLAGSAQQLPYLDRIQRAFGPHDVSGVRAHVGGGAARASEQMGAVAYASGDAVAFRSTPDLHTAAHEAAHVVQQRAGVSLAGGVGQVGDPYERHADQVADAVVRGDSAAPLLSAAVGGAAATPATQQKAGVQFYDGDLGGGLPPGGVPMPEDSEGEELDEALDQLPEQVPEEEVEEAPADASQRSDTSTRDGAGAEHVEGPEPLPEPEVLEPEEPELGGGEPESPQPGGSDTPASGFDWTNLFLNLGRTALEFGRFSPGIGLLTGVAADAIEGYQNYTTLDGLDSPNADKLRTLLVVRQITTGVNNAINHVNYLGTLTQNVLAGSVIGSKLVAITAPINSTLSSINAFLTSFNLTLDVGLAVIAGMEGNRAAALGEPGFEQFHSLKRAFIVNAATGTISIFLDLVDVASAGLAQTSPLKQAAEVIKKTQRPIGNMHAQLSPLINSWVSVWGADVYEWVFGGPEAPAPAADPVQGAFIGAAPVQASFGGAAVRGAQQVHPSGMLRSVAGAIMMGEINNIERAYQLGAGAVEFAMTMPQRVADFVNEEVSEITGHPEPFIWLRDRISDGIEEGTAQVSRMLEIRSMAGQAQSAAQTASSHLDTALSSIDSIQMPEIPDPAPSDYGDSLLGRGAAAVADRALQARTAAVRRLRNSFQGGIDRVKGVARERVQSAKDEMEWGVEFLADFQTLLNEQTGQIRELGATFAERLSQVENVEDIMNMFLGMATDVLGMDELTVDDLRQMWEDIRAQIDRGFEVARSVAQDVGGGGQGGGAQGGGGEAQPAGAPAPAAAAG